MHARDAHAPLPRLRAAPVTLEPPRLARSLARVHARGPPILLGRHAVRASELQRPLPRRRTHGEPHRDLSLDRARWRSFACSGPTPCPIFVAGRASPHPARPSLRCARPLQYKTHPPTSPSRTESRRHPAYRIPHTAPHARMPRAPGAPARGRAFERLFRGRIGGKTWGTPRPPRNTAATCPAHAFEGPLRTSTPRAPRRTASSSLWRPGARPRPAECRSLTFSAPGHPEAPAGVAA